MQCYKLCYCAREICRSLSRIVCRGQEVPKDCKGILRADFQANVTTSNRKKVVRNLVIVRLRQFWVNDVWTLRGRESSLMNKKGLKLLWCHCCCLQYCDSDGWRVVGRSGGQHLLLLQEDLLPGQLPENQVRSISIRITILYLPGKLAQYDRQQRLSLIWSFWKCVPN